MRVDNLPMRKVFLLALVGVLLLGCEEALEAIPRTTVLLVVGQAGPSLTVLQNNLPDGASINLPEAWDTLSVQTAMGVVVVDAEADTSALFRVADYTLLYDTTTGMYLGLDSTGIPLWMDLSPGDPVWVASAEDTVSGVLPSCPEVTITQLPDTVSVGEDIGVSWEYSEGTPDSVLVELRVGDVKLFSETYPGETTSITVPGASVDTAGQALLSITDYTLSVGAMEGGTPASTVIYTKTEAGTLVIQ